MEVDQSRYRQAVVMLVAADCLSFGARTGHIRFGEETESGKIWIVYSSEHKMDFDHGHRSAEIFEQLSLPEGVLIWSETDEELKMRIGFVPVPDLVAEIRHVV